MIYSDWYIEYIVESLSGLGGFKICQKLLKLKKGFL